MADFRFRLNPRAGELPHCSAVLNGRATRYEVSDYRTTLSLKSVVRGVSKAGCGRKRCARFFSRASWSRPPRV